MKYLFQFILSSSIPGVLILVEIERFLWNKYLVFTWILPLCLSSSRVILWRVRVTYQENCSEFYSFDEISVVEFSFKKFSCSYKVLFFFYLLLLDGVYYYYLLPESFPHEFKQMVSHWRLSDSKSPQVSRILLSVLAVLSNAVIWIVSIRPPTSKSSRPFNNPFVIVPTICERIWLSPNLVQGSFFRSSILLCGYLESASISTPQKLSYIILFLISK